jgi:two-component sensor histidine kinase
MPVGATAFAVSYLVWEELVCFGMCIGCRPGGSVGVSTLGLRRPANGIRMPSMPESAEAEAGRRESPLLMILYLLAYLSVLVRMVLNSGATVPALAYGLMAGFLALAIAQQSLRRWPAATQTVFSMNLTAEAARVALRDDPQKAAGLIDRLQELARDALAEMRTLVRELCPSSVEDEGLVASLQRLAALRQRRDGLRVDLQVTGEESGSIEAKETVFRTAREALTNVAKHARVSASRLELCFGPAEVGLRVKDAGAGFDTGAASRPESYGLLAMRERIEALGGTLSIRSAPGAGTEVQAHVPIGTTPVEVT